MKVVWLTALAFGALLAASQTSRAQYEAYDAPYPPPYVPPAYTQRQLIPDLPPVVSYKPLQHPQLPLAGPGVPQGGPEGPLPPGAIIDGYGCPPGYGGDAGAGYGADYPPALYNGYANLPDVQTGWYIAGMAGAQYLEDQHSEAVDAKVFREVDAAFLWYGNGGGALGYRWPTRPRDLGQLRLELDTVYGQNNVKTLLVNGVERGGLEGQVASQSGMVNLVLDFIHYDAIFVPYIGGGVGVLAVNEHLEWNNTDFFDTDLVFGFQGMAGLSVKLTERIEWFTEYRYRGGSNPKLILINPNDSTDRTTLRSEYNSHAIMSGLRIMLH